MELNKETFKGHFSKVWLKLAKQFHRFFPEFTIGTVVKLSLNQVAIIVDDAEYNFDLGSPVPEYFINIWFKSI